MARARPVLRTQFLQGKYMGGVAIMAGYALITGIAMLVFSHLQNRHLMKFENTAHGWIRAGKTKFVLTPGRQKRILRAEIERIMWEMQEKPAMRSNSLY